VIYRFPKVAFTFNLFHCVVALRKLFKFLDADNSGYVSYEEFAKAIMRMNIHPRHEVGGLCTLNPACPIA
jgi:hypothetical protein